MEGASVVSGSGFATPGLLQELAGFQLHEHTGMPTSRYVSQSTPQQLRNYNRTNYSTTNNLETFSLHSPDLPPLENLILSLQKHRKCKSLDLVKLLHVHICSHGLEPYKSVGGHLIPMYVACGNMPYAHQIFCKLVDPDEYCWTFLLQGFIKSGESRRSLDLFTGMQEDCVRPSRFTFAILLKACAKLKCVERGLEIHAQAVKEECGCDPFVGTALVDMYAKCGSLLEAQEIFDELVVRDVVSWTALIAGYAELGLGQQVVDCLKHMQLDGTSPNAFTFVCSLKASVTRGDAECGQEIHAEIIKEGLEKDTFVGNTLVDMYAKCGLIAAAQDVFDELPARDVVSWNALISAYVERGLGKEALNVFQCMKLEHISPDAVTYISSLKACGSIGAIERGREIHTEINATVLKRDPFVCSTLVDMYIKCGSLAEARDVFDQLPVRVVASWNALIAGYVEHGCGEEALNCLKQMQLEGKSPDDITFLCSLKACGNIGAVNRGREIHAEICKHGFERDSYIGNTLVDMYAKCSSPAEAQEVFSELPFRNEVSWNALMNGYAEYGLGKKALSCLQQMQIEGVSPNAATFVSSLKACGSVGAIDKGREIHSEVIKKGFAMDLSVCSSAVAVHANSGNRSPAQINSVGELQTNTVLVLNALVDMYGKCGSMIDAQKVFDAMCTKDLVTWTALASGYARQGDSGLVFYLFDQMREDGIQPDKTAFLSILTACCHLGSIDKGLEYFDAMSKKYGLTPTIAHYSCMVDLLCRAGQLDEAVAMLEKMPFEPDLPIWSILLDACHKWGNVELGRHAFEHAVTLDKTNAAAFILMSNIYADACMLEDMKKIEAWKVRMQHKFNHTKPIIY